jgi:RNA polymerase-binding protein DksA
MTDGRPLSLDTTRFRSELLEERARVQAALASLRDSHPGSLDDEVDEIADGSDTHVADTASATLGREIDYTLGENSGHVLAEIDGALARIEAGTYGTCAVCGKEIAPERLEAYPWASLCIDDARKAERG